MPWPYPRLIAHRGGRLAPENTLPAFAAAAARGYRAVECDVTLTADGHPVLFHDETLERTAGGSGPVAAATLAELSTLDAGAWFHPRFAGTRIPTLAAALAQWRDLGLQALIELKLNPGQDAECLGTTVATLVAQAVARDAWPEPPLFISFSAAALAAAATTAPAIPRALLLERPWPTDWRTRMTAAHASALDLDHRMVTAAVAAELRAAGVPLVTWTVNDPARVAELLAWGVDGVTTDVIDLIAP